MTRRVPLLMALRSRGWIVGSLLLAVGAIGLALVGVFGVSLSRDQFA